MPDLENLTAPAVAIVYANGSIVDGEGTEDDMIYGNTLAEQLAQVRKNDDIKAVVLRVNSPGGSALASDVVWREMTLLQQQKPVVVSMGSYAASGGYYISAPADVILADRMTLTGSIGVFGAFPITGKLLEDKLGITFDGVKTNSSADFGQGFLFGAIRPINSNERNLLMRSVDKVYDSFTTKVSEGRNLAMEHVLDIAGGRVWSGVDALKVGLIDNHGGLKAAIAVAAEKAGLENYRVEEQLSELDPFTALFSGIGVSLKSHLFTDPITESLAPYKKALEIYSQQGVVMYLPYQYSF
jgi:protease-4